jgi:hypothetical protein
MSLFTDEIEYWNNQYQDYCSLESTDSEPPNEILNSLEKIDALFSGKNIGTTVNLAGIYINGLLRPRTTFKVLSGIDEGIGGIGDNGEISESESDNSARNSVLTDSIITAKCIIDSISTLYSDFDIDNYISEYPGEITKIQTALEGIESEIIENMTLDDLSDTLNQISAFFDLEGNGLLDYKAALIYLDEKGFESVAARLQHDFSQKEQNDPDNNIITVDTVIDYIVKSLEELEEQGYDTYEFKDYNI